MLQTWIIYDNTGYITREIKQCDTKQEAHQALMELATEMLNDPNNDFYKNKDNYQVNIVDKETSLKASFVPVPIQQQSRNVFGKSLRPIPDVYRAVFQKYPEVREKAFDTLDELNQYFLKLNFQRTPKDYKNCIINIQYMSKTNMYLVQYWDN